MGRPGREDRAHPTSWLFALVLLASAALLTACGGSPGGHENTKWGEVVWGQDAWSSP